MRFLANICMLSSSAIICAAAMYRGMPTVRLNGNVRPSDSVSEMAGLAAGSASRIAAGTAM